MTYTIEFLFQVEFELKPIFFNAAGLLDKRPGLGPSSGGWASASSGIRDRIENALDCRLKVSVFSE